MRALLQRVQRAKVSVDNQVAGEIGPGLLVLLGVAQEDSSAESLMLAEKTAHLRIFPDQAGKLNKSVLDAGGQVLVVSQFTLYADCTRGRRPSFTQAALPEVADGLYQDYVAALKELGVPVATGIFQTDMQVELVNDGPVTIMLDSELKRKK